LQYQCYFKIEGGTTGDKEVPAEITTTEEWVEYVIDFSEFVDSDNTKLVIFLNSGQYANGGKHLLHRRHRVASCPIYCLCGEFRNTRAHLTNGGYFENGSLNDMELMSSRILINQVLTPVIPSPFIVKLLTALSLGLVSSTQWKQM
jgi:hypothetical protein